MSRASIGASFMERRIPKRIIQTGREDRLRLLHRAAMASIRLLNPEFDYRFFNDDQVVAFFDSEFGQFRAVFDRFRFPIQRYDFFRYLAIYRYGGFYFDLDVLLASNISPLIEHDCIFTFDDLNISRFLRHEHGMDWTVGNYAFGATPGNPFLWAVIENCIRAQDDRGWVGRGLRGIPRLFRDDFFVLSTTGPWLVSRTFAENPKLAEDVTVLFPQDVRDPASWHKFGDWGVHLMEGSWRTRDKFVRRKLRVAWENWEFARLMKQSDRLAASRRRAATS